MPATMSHPDLKCPTSDLLPVLGTLVRFPRFCYFLLFLLRGPTQARVSRRKADDHRT